MLMGEVLIKMKTDSNYTSPSPYPHLLDAGNSCEDDGCEDQEMVGNLADNVQPATNNLLLDGHHVGGGEWKFY